MLWNGTKLVGPGFDRDLHERLPQPHAPPMPQEPVLPKHQQPSLRDVRRVYRLLGACTELGADSVQWRQHLLAGLCDIVGAKVGLYMHIHQPLTRHERIEAPMAHGLTDAADIARWQHYQVEQAQVDDPFHRRYYHNHKRPLRTRDLADVLDLNAWHRTRHFNEYIRPCGLGDRITSSLRLPANICSSFDPTQPQTGTPGSPLVVTTIAAPLQTLVMHRDAADGPYGPGAKHLVRMLHHEMAGLLGKQLVMPEARRDTSQLPPRMGQVLDGLLAGKTEKQIAAELHLSPHTVNRHVQRVYKHYDVGRKAELIALLNRS